MTQSWQNAAETASFRRAPVAAFDVDKTLVVRDCVVPFIRRVHGKSSLGSVVRMAPSMGTHVLRRNRDAVKEAVVREVFAGRSSEAVRELGRSFADEVMSSWMRDDVARRLRHHQDSGHVVVLVSASLDAYLDPLGEMLGVDGVLCTRLETDSSGTLTGELVGPNCRGEAKVAALETWRREPLTAGNSWLTYAYGDSAGDQAMLDVASHGINVRRTTLTQSC